MDLGLICAQLLLLLGRYSDAEPNYGLPAPQVGDHYGMEAQAQTCWRYLQAAGARHRTLCRSSGRHDCDAVWAADVFVCGVSRCPLP